MASQRTCSDMGGTMRLGAYPCRLRPGSQVAQIYGVSEISERHRHRYEVDNGYRDLFAEHGHAAAGLSPDGSLVEMIELPEHPWFVGCQFHPELQVAAHAAAPAVRELRRAPRYDAAGARRCRARPRSPQAAGDARAADALRSLRPGGRS